MRKDFPIRIVCFLLTLLMAIMSCFPIGEYDIVYAQEGDYLTHFTYNFENYEIIIFFCICILLCNLTNKMKWMWMWSFGLLVSYPIIRRISLLERIMLKADLEAKGMDVINISYVSNKNSTLLTLYCVGIFVLCFILFLVQRKEEQRIASLFELKMREEKEKEIEEKKNYEKLIFPDAYLDNPLQNR